MQRYVREIICGKRKEIRYWQITTDPEELPSNTTWYVLSKYPDITPREVGNFYGLRTWVEYGLKQSGAGDAPPPVKMNWDGQISV